jgi:Tfp pilus assembly protein PilX
VVSQSAESVLCKREIQLTNYSGTPFQLEVNREVRLLPANDAVTGVGGKLSAGVSAVAFETVNTVKNTGAAAWTKESGLLSIWILGMFNASTESTVVVPFEKGTEAKLGPIVNDSYFGKVPAERLVVKEDVLFFRADA